jgi:hypothetical protein
MPEIPSDSPIDHLNDLNNYPTTPEGFADWQRRGKEIAREYKIAEHLNRKRSEPNGDNVEQRFGDFIDSLTDFMANEVSRKFHPDQWDAMSKDQKMAFGRTAAKIALFFAFETFNRPPLEDLALEAWVDVYL